MELSPLFEHTKSLLGILTLVWGLFSLLNLFHSKIPLFWRITVIFAFFVFIFLYFPILKEEYNLWKINYKYKPLEIFEALFYIFQYLDIFLYLSWCYFLIKVFFSAKEKSSENIIKFLVIFTLFYWIFSFLFQKNLIHLPYKEYYRNLLDLFNLK